MRVTNLLSSAVKCLQLQGASPPWPGALPWTPLGAPPPDPHIRSRSRARHILSVPVLFLTGNEPCQRLSKMCQILGMLQFIQVLIIRLFKNKNSQQLQWAAARQKWRLSRIHTVCATSVRTVFCIHSPSVVFGGLISMVGGGLSPQAPPWPRPCIWGVHSSEPINLYIRQARICQERGNYFEASSGDAAFRANFWPFVLYNFRHNSILISKGFGHIFTQLSRAKKKH